MKKSSLFFILMVVFGVALVGVYFGTKQTETSVPSTTLSPTPSPSISIAPPTLPSFYQKEPKNVQFTFDGTSPSFPKEVFLYDGAPQNEASVASSFASYLSLSNYKKQTLPKTTIDTWTNNNYSLAHSRHTLSLTLTNPVIGTASPQLVELADVPFFYSFIPSFYTIKSRTAVAQEPSGLVVNTKDSLSLFKKDYDLLLEKTYPILTNTGNAPVSLVVDKNNRIFSLFFAFSFRTTTKTRIISTPSLSAALNALNNNKGRLLRVLVDAGEYQWETDPTFTSVSLKAVSLVYIIDHEKNRLFPAFFFEGTGNNNQEVAYLLWLTL